MLQKAIANEDQRRAARLGVIYGALSYGLWGLIPLYFKWVAGVPPLQVLAHRVVWSFVLLAVVVVALGRLRDLRPAFRSARVMLTLTASTLLLALNWFTYIYAVSTNQVVEASLGYFLNPLVNVVLGVAILKEHLRRWQIASIALAALGVAILGAPLIAVTLAVSFAFYGLLRKTVAVDGLLGLGIETVLLVPLAAGYLAYVASRGDASFTLDDPATCFKLAASGIVTAAPLLLFTAAARRLRFATLGFLQYLAPTVQFILAVAVFDEPLSDRKLTALVCIWIAVGMYTVDTLRHLARERRELAQPAPADV
jgi:chloramphenicol-sensitive protein RarD